MLIASRLKFFISENSKPKDSSFTALPGARERIFGSIVATFGYNNFIYFDYIDNVQPWRKDMPLSEAPGEEILEARMYVPSKANSPRHERN